MSAIHGPSEFLPMTFYFSAPYALPEGNARASWYGFGGTPSVMFDGVMSEVGGLASGSMFPYYSADYASRSPIASPLVMTGSYTIIAGQVDVSFDIQVDQAISGSNTVHVFVCQDGLHGHPNMVVDIQATEAFTLSSPGQSTTVTRTFPMDPSWNEQDLRIIALVQNNSSRTVLQAVQASPNYACTVTMDCVPDGVEAGWRLQGPSGLDLTGNGDTVLQFFEPGQFTLTWDNLPWWTAPAGNPDTKTVATSGAITFTGQYSDGPFAADASLPLGDPGDGCGVSLVDVDEDGDLDLHLVNNGTADRLLANDGSGVFTDMAAGPVADGGAGRSCLWADFNGDGHLDAYLVKENQANVLLDGDGVGNFTLDPAYGVGDTGPGFAAAFVDYERDGDLDIYIVQNGAANVLLQNIGDPGVGYNIFMPVSGGTAGNIGNGVGAALTDGDLDGFLDVYVPNRFNPNFFMQDTPLGYNDISNSSGLADVGNGTGAAWGDYDNDGDLDLYLANEGNADHLFRCTGPFQYTQVPDAVVNDGGNGRGAAWLDVDNDGWLDLYVARNGQSDLLLINDQTGGFFRVMVGASEAGGPGRGVVCGDLDGDHRTDVVVSRQGAANFMLRNLRATGNRWLDLSLQGAGANTSAVGARILVTSGGMTQTRLVTACTGYMGSAPLKQHFGLGTATTVDQVEIHWPDGTVQNFGPIGANLDLTVVQGQNPVSGVDDLPLATALDGAYPNPFNPRTAFSFTLDRDDHARLDVFDIRGRLVRTVLDQDLAAGEYRHAAAWDGTDNAGQAVPSGTYFYRLETGSGFTDTGKMQLVK